MTHAIGLVFGFYLRPVTLASLFRQNCNVWQSEQQCSSVYTNLQTRRVWSPKSTSLVTKVDDFGFQGSKN